MRPKNTLSQSPYQHFEQQQKLSAKGMKIRAIDSMAPLISKSIKVLNLSDNQISCLDNIQQFINLEHINIKNNKIKQGQELLKLTRIKKFYKMQIMGNPFLEDPLDEDILELIIEKQTDIEILSGQTLKKIHELEEGELKTIFLQNYIKKVGYHKEMLSRQGSSHTLSKKSDNNLIFNNVLPQFYNVLEDPEIKLKLKKETLGLKRESKKSFEEAVEIKKQRQDVYVQNLIKDIVLLVEEDPVNQRESSPEKEREFQYENIQGSRARKQKSNVSSNQASQFISPRISPLNNQGPLVENLSPFRYRFFKKAPKKDFQPNSSLKASLIKNRDEVKENQNKQRSIFFSFSHREGEQDSRNQKKDRQIREVSIVQESSVKNQKQSSKKENRKQNSFIKKLELQPPQKQSSFNLESFRSNQIEEKQHNSIVSIPNSMIKNPNSYEYYENIYYHSLPKYDSTFTMLFSDFSSLSPQQKDILIDALQKDHRLKTIQLYKMEDKIIALKQEEEGKEKFLRGEIGQLLGKLKEQEQMNILKEEYLKNSQKQNMRLSEIIQGLVADYKNLRQLNQADKKLLEQKQQKLNTLEGQFSSLKLKLTSIETQNLNEQKIKKNYERRIKKTYYKEIVASSVRMKKIQEWKEGKDQQKKDDLLVLSWNMLKRNYSQGVVVKIKEYEHNSKILANAFEKWVQFKQQQKQLKQKEAQLKIRMLRTYLKEFGRICLKKYAMKKEGNLKNYWANQHLTKKIMYRFMRNCGISRKKEQQKCKFSDSYYRGVLEKRMFGLLKNNIKAYDGLVDELRQALRRQKIKYNLWKMITGCYRVKNKEAYLKQTEKIGNILATKKKYGDKKTYITRFYENIRGQSYKVNKYLKLLKRKKLAQLMGIFRNKKNSVNALIHKRNTLINSLNKLTIKQYFQSYKNKSQANLRLNSKLKRLFKKVNKFKLKNNLLDRKKQFLCSMMIYKNRTRQAFYFLMRHSFLRKIVESQLEHKHELAHTEAILSKMKSISVTEMENVRAEYEKYQKELEMKILDSEAEHRQRYILLEEKFLSLADELKLLESDNIGKQERELAIQKQKQLILEQLRLKNEQNEENYLKIQRLKTDYVSMQGKYDRILDLYTKMTFELQRKQRESSFADEKDRQRKERTIQKRSYPRNDYISPRNYQPRQSK